MNRLIFFLVAISMISCGVSVNYDYDANTDFNSYKTYHFYDDLDSGLTVLDERRLIRAMDSSLQEKGYTKSNNPSFLIDIKGASTRIENSPSVSVGFGGTGSNTAGGIGVNVPINSNQNYDEILIEFVDKMSEQTFWLADLNVLITNSDSPVKRDAYFQELVEKIFSKYPPKVKKK